MFRGLFRLTWLEIKIFMREPLGVAGTVGVPVLIFVMLGRIFGRGAQAGAPAQVSADLPILASLLIVVSAVLSLVAIISIYREGGILKRLRATPLRAHTILTAHVLVKLLFTALTLALMIAAGRRSYPVSESVPLVSFGAALVFCTGTLMSLGFLIASLVPTARFAQPIATLVLYPMLAVSGLFVPVAALPPALQTLAKALPFSYAVALLRGIWLGEGWAAHAGNAAALVLVFVVCAAISARVFRWE